VHPGAGAEALVGGATIRIDRPDDLPDEMAGARDELARSGETPVAVRRDGVVLGLVSVTDRVKPDAERAVSRLREMGLQVELVSGDREASARAIAAIAGIDVIRAEAFPADKVTEVERLKRAGKHVVFVGDGINDAPALAAAHVGIAMGTGTDVALAAADMTLLGGSLEAVADALDLARRTYRIIGQNLVWAFAYNVMMIPLAVVGVLTPTWAAAAMAGSSVSVVLNALRLRRFRPIMDGRNGAASPDVVTRERVPHTPRAVVQGRER
jgi:Cu+-exporting ATPase